MSCTCIPDKFLCREAVRAWELDPAKDKIFSPIKHCSDEHIDIVEVV